MGASLLYKLATGSGLPARPPQTQLGEGLVSIMLCINLLPALGSSVRDGLELLLRTPPAGLRGACCT